MAEEHRCQASEGHRLCANNCGFFGSPATMNMCSKCYRDYCLKEQQAASIKASLSASSPSFSPSPAIDSLSSLTLPVVTGDVQNTVAEVATAMGTVQQPNRCSVCRKRVGLTGFKCRCGITFCGSHRYPEKHDCTFDYKTAGREDIARANPLVKGEKLHKI
ncbi:hypothetical protein HS088_TW03G00835 [Tripterygium wilfordii]|uniref:Zinc finger A20 and AN1 domain-containing stress-associated protein 4 n=2 Tax=Tripterygium wilfordii TaxID=458696 RepID=A0A7J7DVV3_TRIWF|nr:zinc finger A20 and AN1 domain-containing stress-associated protein 4 isoform X2 [Tripterygium wilfordii]XP_038697816.1 zinc finger A20 and AN1 domain-containing stress-associated protein 4 isoform X2 [Tripterygium wilfordii]KAF5750498.1 hypothetical protein HS088_TW03G00835 [Tripterygium wilfordii]